MRAALGSADPEALIDTFAAICREVKDRTCAIHHVLATAAVVDDEAADLLAEVRRQAHTGRSRIVAALRRMDALDPALTRREAEDIVYTCLVVRGGAHPDRRKGLERRAIRGVDRALAAQPAAPRPTRARRSSNEATYEGGVMYLTARRLFTGRTNELLEDQVLEIERRPHRRPSDPAPRYR